MSKITGVTILAICAAVVVPMTVSSPTDAQTLLTLDVSPTEAQAGSTVTAAWSGIPNPTSTDWIGLFEPGAPNTAFLDWMYVSCSKTPGAAVAAGSCPLVIPGALAPGPYELRLLANNGLMAATLNNTASGLWTHGTSATFDHEVLAGANRYLLVITGSFDPVAIVAPSSVTYGGVNLIRLHGVEDDSKRTEIWGWDPGQGEVPVGIASVVVTWPGGGQEDIFPSAVSFLGVDWAGAPVGGFTSEIDTIDPGPQPSIDVTSGSADDLVLDALNSDDPDALTPGVGQTYVFSPSDTPTMSISSKPGIAGPVTMEWTDLSTFVQYLHLGFTVRASQAVATSLAAKALTVTGSASTLGVTPTEVEPGGTVTATWNGIPTPTSTDWIGLFERGGQNTAFLDWVYVSCSRTPGGAAAAGACPFVIPAGLAAGTYELRLLAADGFSHLAVSGTFTVAPGGRERRRRRAGRFHSAADTERTASDER